MSEITNIVLPDSVLLDVRAVQARDVLKQMALALEFASGADGAAMHAALMSAELSGGSSIGGGVAVVGVRVPAHVSMRKLCGFMRLARPVMFRGMDESPCDLVCVLISPEDEAQVHLRDLSGLIRAFKDEAFLSALNEADNAVQITQIFRARGLRAGMQKAA